jgi:glycine C-acetyltransferase
MEVKSMQTSENKNTKKVSEDFNLRDLFRLKGKPVEERALFFDQLMKINKKAGTYLYRREICSPMDREVTVFDEYTGAEKTMLMFGSNNYLGLANNETVKSKVKQYIDSYGTGIGGPPLLNGTSGLHRKLEVELAKFKGKEDSLLFPSGYQANLAWVTSLIDTNDILLYDELSHASLLDGIKMAKGMSRIEAKRFKHNDVAHLESLLSEARTNEKLNNIFITVEGVYSMDGDLAPLDEIAPLLDKYQAYLVIDDAHGIGVLGERGEGISKHFNIENDRIIVLGTFSKSLASSGGFIAGPTEIVNYMRFCSRPYMFSAHIPITTVAMILSGLEIMLESNELVQRLRRNSLKLRQMLRDEGFEVEDDPSAIIPIIVPKQTNIRKLSRYMHDSGIFVNSIEFPAVPLELQRLRISVMATHTDEDLERLMDVLRSKRNELLLLN